MIPEPLPPGRKPTRAHLNALGAAIDERTALPGHSERLTKYPWGTIHNQRRHRGGGGYVSPIFQPTVTAVAGGAYEVRWARGLIAGIEPNIEGKPIGTVDEATGQNPALHVAPEAFGDTAEALIYFQLNLNVGGWYVESIVPIAVPLLPAATAWRAYKLGLILFADGTLWRAMHVNQGYLSVNRRSSGIAQHIFWGMF